MYRVVIILLLALMPCIAHANAGVPMLFVVMPALAWSLIPIIALETIYIAKKIQISNGQSAAVTILSNIFSTIIGVPITWFLMAIAGGGIGFVSDPVLGKIISVTLKAAWLSPAAEADLNWMVPIAWLFLLIPFFFVSWWSESYIVRKLLMFKDKKEVSTACRNANIITYSLLALWPLGNYFFNLHGG